MSGIPGLVTLRSGNPAIDSWAQTVNAYLTTVSNTMATQKDIAPFAATNKALATPSRSPAAGDIAVNISAGQNGAISGSVSIAALVSALTGNQAMQQAFGSASSQAAPAAAAPGASTASVAQIQNQINTLQQALNSLQQQLQQLSGNSSSAVSSSTVITTATTDRQYPLSVIAQAVEYLYTQGSSPDTNAPTSVFNHLYTLDQNELGTLNPQLTVASAQGTYTLNEAVAATAILWVWALGQGMNPTGGSTSSSSSGGGGGFVVG